MYRKYCIVESIESSVSQYESYLDQVYRDQVYRYTPSQSPCLVGLLTSGSKTCGQVTESNYPKPHLTFLVMSF